MRKIVSDLVSKPTLTGANIVGYDMYHFMVGIRYESLYHEDIVEKKTEIVSAALSRISRSLIS